MFKALLCHLIVCATATASAATYYVSPAGSDRNSGTSEDQPFRVVQHAVDRMHSGDTLVVLDGIYTGTVKLKSGITIKAQNPRKVVFSGVERLKARFERHDGNIYKTRISGSPKQFFYNNQPMTWARWPNGQWSENWIAEKKWAMAIKGTGPGVLTSKAFAEVKDLDLSGGYCFIRYALGNSCYSRKIESFDGKILQWNDDKFYSKGRSGGDGINASPEVAASVSKAKYDPSNSHFFLAGAFDLLDAPGEWFVQDGWLYLIAPAGSDPNETEVMVKHWNFVIAGDKALSDVAIEGVDFFATSISLTDGGNRNIAFSDVHFTYIGEELLFIDRQHGRGIDKPVLVNGTGISFDNCLFAGARNSALKVTGSDITVHNCVFMENNRHANFESRALFLEPEGNYRVTRNTFFNNGSDAIFISPELDKMPESVRPEVGYNHIFNGGLYNTDCSGVYMPTKSQRFAAVHHSWMHNINGVAMRMDLAGMELNVHHNVFWESQKAISIEGYRDFNIYNNTDVHNRTYSVIIKNIVDHSTVKGEGSGDMSFPPIDDWNVVNNLMERFFDKAGSRDMDLYKKSYEAGTTYPKRNARSLMSVSDRGQVRGNMIKFDHSVFVNGDLNNLDLRPAANARQVRGGVRQTPELEAQEVKQLGEYRGAYDMDDDYWAPGSDWMPYGLPVIKTMAEAERFAKKYSTISIVPEVGIGGLPFGLLNVN
ncbi:right-handed parallel beta-helix repeat-containing protein [Planctomycetota bacterium]